MSSEFTDKLRDLADNHEFLYNVPRKAIEDVLVDNRDGRISFPFRNNGVVVKEADGTASSIIRLPTEMAIGVGLRAIADYLDENGIE